MNTYNTEDVVTWSKVARTKSEDKMVLGYINLIESRAFHACDLVHALKMFSEGRIDAARFKQRMKDLTHSTHMAPLKKISCPVCHRYFWTNQPRAAFCSTKCRKAMARALGKY